MRLSTLEDQVPPLSRDRKATSLLVFNHDNHIEDMYNRLRRYIKILGLPKHIEGKDHTGYVENWLLEIIGKQSLHPFLQ